MKFNLILPVIFLLFILNGCAKKEEKNNNVTKKDSVVNTTPIPTVINKPDTTNQTQDKNENKEPEKQTKEKSAVTRVNFPAGETQVILDGKINGINDKIIYVVSGKKNQSILARVMAKDANANIRVGQIISPSGKIAGPFDIKIKYDLEETGDWQVTIAEYPDKNSWKGDFQILLSLN